MVRCSQTKTGCVATLEAPIGENAGLFLRASRGSGNLETYAFTDIDRQVPFGGQLIGSLWGPQASPDRRGPRRQQVIKHLLRLPRTKKGNSGATAVGVRWNDHCVCAASLNERWIARNSLQPVHALLVCFGKVPITGTESWLEALQRRYTVTSISADNCTSSAATIMARSWITVMRCRGPIFVRQHLH